MKIGFTTLQIMFNRNGKREKGGDKTRFYQFSGFVPLLKKRL